MLLPVLPGIGHLPSTPNKELPSPKFQYTEAEKLCSRPEKKIPITTSIQLKERTYVTQHWLASLWYCESKLFVWHLMVARINLLCDHRQIIFCCKLTQANLLIY